MKSEVKSTCCYCGVGCGVLIEHDGMRITGVRGDPEHPANLGRLCTKGASLHLAARPASRAPTPPRRNTGNGPRPSGPRLVDGPSVPRGGFTASNPRRDTARWRNNDAYSDEGRQDSRDARDPRDTAPRGRSNFGAGQPAPQGYIGADFKPRTRSGNNGFVAGAPAGKPGRKGPRR